MWSCHISIFLILKLQTMIITDTLPFPIPVEMHLQTTLVQELETAKILQQLSRRSVVKNPTKLPTANAALKEEPKNSLKRKHWSTIETDTPSSCTQSPTIGDSAIAGGRPVSPGTDNDSLDESSSHASLSLPEGAFKPLSAPPKLMRFSFQTTDRPTSSSSRIHPSPVKYEAKSISSNPAWALPSTVNNSVTPIYANATYKMMLQLWSNPLLSTKAIIPVCLPVGNEHVMQGQTTINILPKVPIASTGVASSATDGSSKTNNTKRKICRMDDCNEEAARRTPYCKNHCGQRKCEFEGCKKCAQGRTRFCIGHGGGRRCQFEGCTKGARDKQFCASHGGGRRCNIECCTKLAVGKGRTCTAHGGGRRCQHESCSKSAQSSSDYW